MSYENINANTNIVFINGMGNTLEYARNSANLIQRGFLNKQVGLMNNATRGLFNDVLEYSSPLSTKDSLNAYMLQKLPKDSVVITHSAGNEDIYKANRINATTNTETKYYLVSVGSPIAESELRESTASVGAELVRQVNDSRDPVANPTGAALDAITSGAMDYLKGGSGFISMGVGGIRIINTTKDRFNKYHPFETYYQNEAFQIKQTIENALIKNISEENHQNSIKGLNNGD